jgi:CDP-diacylglycerol--glycerol-3-phosphate 3-phosphatidyltransferase
MVLVLSAMTVSLLPDIGRDKPWSAKPARYPRLTMLGIHARPQIARVTEPVARRLASAGVTPDALTIVGTVGVAGGALGFYPRGHFFVGTLVITAFVFSDMLDGAVARARGSSGPWGAFLDSTLDRIGDGAVFGALALWYAGAGNSEMLCAVALYDLVAGAVTSYAKARAESLGMTCNVGVAERSERLLAVLVLTGLSGLFGVPVLRDIALWGLAAATTVTVVQRVVEVRRQSRLLPTAAGMTQPAAPSHS